MRTTRVVWSAAIAAALFVALEPGTGPRGAMGMPLHSLQMKAREIVERAISAHGGRQAWLGKRDAVFSTTWTHYRAGQPRFTSRYVVKFPIADGPVRTVVEGEENGKPVVMGVSGSRSWFFVGGERYEDVDSLRANRAFVKKAYGLLAVPFRLEDPSYSLTYDGQEVRFGSVVDRVRVEHGLEPATLYLFDRKSGRLVGMGSAVADPPTFTVSDYVDFIEVDGIVIPRTLVVNRVDMATGGRPRALTVSVDQVKFRNGLPSETFEPPVLLP